MSKCPGELLKTGNNANTDSSYFYYAVFMLDILLVMSRGRDITNSCRHEPAVMAKGGKVSVSPQKNRFVTAILLGEVVVS